LNPSLTIVIPVHNGESRLRGCVGEILEVASELTRDFSVLIVDDGSTDDTFAAAEELSALYPQISVRRHRQRRGLGPTLEIVQRRVRADIVIVHDGVSPIDPNQLRTLWRNHLATQTNFPAAQALSDDSSTWTLSDAVAAHAAMARAHGRLSGFLLLTPSAQGEPEASEVNIATSKPRTDAGRVSGRRGVGQIPPLPRPKFLSAVAQFALGE
jgi:hypothetical protein